MKYTPFATIQTYGYNFIVIYRDGKEVIVKTIQEAIKLYDEEKERITNG